MRGRYRYQQALQRIFDPAGNRIKKITKHEHRALGNERTATTRWGPAVVGVGALRLRGIGLLFEEGTLIAFPIYRKVKYGHPANHRLYRFCGVRHRASVTTRGGGGLGGGSETDPVQELEFSWELC